MRLLRTATARDRPGKLRAAIARRLGTLGLELHPGKTKIVYCKDANRRGDFGHTSFDFLGYTFRGRLAKGPRGVTGQVFAALLTDQAVTGIQGSPSASMTRASKKLRPCLAAVDR